MPLGSILVVDDDEDVRDLLRDLLEAADYKVTMAEDGGHASKVLAKETFTLVLTELLMPDKDGIQLVGEVRKKYPATPIIVMSGGGRLPNVEYLKMANSFGANAVLEKPFKSDRLLQTIASVLAAKPTTEKKK